MKNNALKMKVGDVAIVIASNDGHRFELGEIIEIVTLYPDADDPHYFCENHNDGGWWLNDLELEQIKL